MGFPCFIHSMKSFFILKKTINCTDICFIILRMFMANYWCLVAFLTNVIFQVIDEFDQSVHFVEIDIEEDQEIAEAAGIMGTPCVQFFKNKEMIRSVMNIYNTYMLIIYICMYTQTDLYACIYTYHIWCINGAIIWWTPHVNSHCLSLDHFFNVEWDHVGGHF